MIIVFSVSTPQPRKVNDEDLGLSIEVHPRSAEEQTDTDLHLVCSFQPVTD